MERKLARARRDLAFVVKTLARRDDVRHKLAELKNGSGDLDRGDFVWHKLLTSFATMGNSRGAQGLIRTPENYRRVTFDALKQKSRRDLIKELRTVLQTAKVRMPEKKAIWLTNNYDRIVDLGGLERAKAELMRRPGSAGKIQFWQEFDGIGPKYARNIMMDVYHPEFRNCIAVDQRVKNLSRLLELKFANYDEEEHFYLDIASRAGLTGWVLDRILYWFLKDVIAGLQDRADVAAAREALKEGKGIPWEQLKKELNL
jgi:hypothetical protein